MAQIGGAFSSSYRPGVPVPTSGSRLPKGYDPARHNFISNLWEDVKSLKGVPGGLYDIGKALVHDAGKTTIGAVTPDLFGEYRLDDIGKAIYQDYAHTYGPALHGDFGKTAERIRQHPLGPALDLLAVVTGGAGLAAKGAKAAALAGGTSAGTRASLMRFAGYEAGKISDLIPTRFSQSAGTTIPDVRALREGAFDSSVPERLKGAILDDDVSFDPRSVIDDPNVASHLRASKVRVDADGGIWRPAKASFDTGGTAPLVVDLASNPVRRLRQKAMGKLGEVRPDAAIIGTQRRAARRVARASQSDRARGISRIELPAAGLIARLPQYIADTAVSLMESAPARVVKRERQIVERQNALREQMANIHRGSGGVKDAQAQLARTTPRAAGDSPRSRVKARSSEWRAAQRVERLQRKIDELEQQKRQARWKHEEDVARFVRDRDIAGGNVARAVAAAVHKDKGIDSSEFREAAKNLTEQQVTDITENVGTIRELMEHLYRAESEIATPAAKEVGRRQRGKKAVDPEEYRAKLGTLILSDKFNLDELEVLGDYLARGSVDDAAKLDEIKAAVTKKSEFDPDKSLYDLANDVITEEVERLKGFVPGASRPMIVSHKILRAEDPTLTKKQSAARKKGRIDESEFLNLEDARVVYSPEHAVAMMSTMVNALHMQKMFDYGFEAARQLGRGEDVPRDHRVIYEVGKDADKNTEMVNRLYQNLTEDIPVLAGGEIPTFLKPTIESIEKLMDAPVGAKWALPKSIYDILYPQLRDSNNAILRFMDKTTNLWRNWTLGARPAWMVNNLVGNLTLMIMSVGVVNTVKALATAPKHAKWLDTDYYDVIHTSMSDALLRDIDRHRRKGESIEEGATRAWYRNPATLGKVNKLPEAGLRLNAKLIDNPMRRALFWSRLRPNVKKLQREMESAGRPISSREAAELLLQDAKFSDDLVQHTLGDLINFRDLTELERSTMRRIIPFYSWIKGMSERTARLVADEPLKADVIVQIGEHGEQVREEELPGTPEWMRGFVRVGGSDDAPKVMSTLGMNPFNTIVDMAEWANMLTGKAPEGELGPLSSIAPLPKAGLEAAMRRDLFTGRKPWEIDDKRGGDPYMSGLGLFTRRVGSQFPTLRLAQDLTGFGPTPSERPTLAPQSRGGVAARYVVGSDFRDVNMANARRSQIMEELNRRRELREREKFEAERA